jgi:hypothetical protein
MAGRQIRAGAPRHPLNGFGLWASGFGYSAFHNLVVSAFRRTHTGRLKPATTGSSVTPEIDLQNQHRIAVAVEPVPLRDRLAVSLEHALPAGECGDEHKQRRPRQVKVRQ